jgi:dolichol-phosphate mannosyltransferase
MISIILPCLNEGENLKILVPEIVRELKRKDYEIIIIDDNSKDQTDLIVKNLKKNYKIKYLKRTNERGLASAVIAGFNLSKGNFIIVMDADYSHPPSVIPEIIKNLNSSADIVVASRYIEGGGVVKWQFLRKFVSVFATLLAKPLVKVKDPLAGFFGIKREVLKNSKLNPLGFKILLEILVKCNYKKVIEIPFIFRERHSGVSKANMKIYFEYNLHLLKLYFYKLKQIFRRILK